MIPDFCCPNCSHEATPANMLFEDVLVVPSILSSTPRPGVKFRDGKYRVIGCPHIREAYGPWETEADAKQAIADRLAELRTAKARAAQQVEASLGRAG